MLTSEVTSKNVKWLQIASFLMVWSYNWEYSIWPTKTEVFSKSCWNDLKLHICWWFWDRIENVWPTQNRSKALFDLNMLEWLQISSIFWHDFVSTFQVNFGLFLRLDWIFSTNHPQIYNLKSCLWSDLWGWLWPMTSFWESNWIF